MCEYLGDKPQCVMKVKAVIRMAEVRSRVRSRARVHDRPIVPLVNDPSQSISVGTRKMVNYA